jgi:hypothetical protein
MLTLFVERRCGNAAAILELDEHLQRKFTFFEAALQESRGVSCKRPTRRRHHILQHCQVHVRLLKKRSNPTPVPPADLVSEPCLRADVTYQPCLTHAFFKWKNAVKHEET